MTTQKMISIEVNADTFQRLQQLAKPFTDSPDCVISRLINYYQSNSKFSNESEHQYYVTKDGIRLPYGEIAGTYKPRGREDGFELKGRICEAGIEFEGVVFDEPSPAANYAKKSVGASESAASTNGWTFWKYVDSRTGKRMSLDEYRKKIDLKNLTLEDLGL